MKNLHIDREVNQQTKDGSRKKSSVLFVIVLCLFIVVIIFITTMLLGNNISKFSDKETNTITLSPPENVSVENMNDGNTNGNNNADENNAGRGAGNQPEGYHGDLEVTDDVQSWKTETYVDLFKESYDGTVNSDDGGKRIAPGTSNYYDFTVKNNGNIPLDYSISLEVGTFFEGKRIDSEIPLEWRLLSADKEIISDWQIYNEKSEVLKEGTLDLKHRDSYTIEWRWIFERGQEMDIEDTELGNLSVNQPIGVNATIYVHAEQSADWDGKTSIMPHTGDDFNPVMYLLIFVISICVLLILIVIYKRRKKDEGIQDGQE